MTPFPPPHSDDRPDERSQQLSAWLDGALEGAEAERVQKLIETDEAYKAEYERLLKLRHLTGRVASEQNLGPEDDSMWKVISGQLQQDEKQAKKNDSAHVDVEFISAYHDCEVAYDDPECVRFEQKLYACAESNRVLADMAGVSELIRNFGYRLEATCTVDVCGDVMRAYGENPDDAKTLADEPDAKFLEISAWADGELHDAAVEIAANKAAYDKLKKLSSNIHNMSAQLEKHAPDVWPGVARELGVTVDNVVPFRRKNIKTWGTIAAAVLLLVWVVPAMNNQNGSDLLSMAPAARQEMAPEASVMSAAEPPAEGMVADVGKLEETTVSSTEKLAAAKEDNLLAGQQEEREMDRLAQADQNKPAENKIALADDKRKKEQRAAQTRVNEGLAKDVGADRDESFEGRELAAATAPVFPAKTRAVGYNSQGVAVGGAGGNFGGRPSSMMVPASAPAAKAAPGSKSLARAEASYDVAGSASSFRDDAAGNRRNGIPSSIPSSEEFLMDSLQEDMGDDEIEVILGL